ncbi:COMM domain-containing protein 1-like [Embiotoca jacksoni]|uniref:COMM domain-containing protein 1-like n=1 Tax=Embiotoca jacksoni TaxID=100190 RepID=UPI003704AD6C
MADVEATKSLSGLLNGIAQKVYYSNGEITEELLKDELYPELSQDEFTALHEKMRGLLKSIATADMDLAQLEIFLTSSTVCCSTNHKALFRATFISTKELLRLNIFPFN